MISKWIERVLARVSQPSTIDGSELSDQQAEYPHVFIPEQVCQETSRSLQSHSPSSPDVWHEGVAYWAGVPVDTMNAIFISTCIVPEAMTAPGWYEVSAAANARVTEAVHEHGIQILGLVHSHPGSGTGHSPTDDNEAFLPFDGYLSTVVPEYARNGMQPLDACGVHRYENGSFRRLSEPEVKSGFTILSQAPTSIDTRY